MHETLYFVLSPLKTLLFDADEEETAVGAIARKGIGQNRWLL